MMPVLALLLAAAPPTLTVADRTVRAGAAKNAWFTIPLLEKPAVVECEYAVESGSAVRAVLLEVNQAVLYNQGKGHHPLSATPLARKGRLRFAIDRPGEYRVAIDNSLDARGPADVRVKLTVTPIDIGPVRTLSTGARAATVALSIGFLACSLGYAGVKLGPALRHRRPPPQPGRLV